MAEEQAALAGAFTDFIAEIENAAIYPLTIPLLVGPGLLFEYPLAHGALTVEAAAAYLFGEHGVLSLLERRGYRLQRVEP